MKLSNFKAVLLLTRFKRLHNCKYPMRKMISPCNKMKMMIL